MLKLEITHICWFLSKEIYTVLNYFLFFLLILISATLFSLLVCFFLILVPFLFEVVLYFTLFLCKFMRENMLVVTLKALFYSKYMVKGWSSFQLTLWFSMIFKPCVCSYGCLFCWKIKLLSWTELGEVCYTGLLWQAWNLTVKFVV